MAAERDRFDQDWARLAEAPEDERQAQVRARHAELLGQPDEAVRQAFRRMVDAEFSLSDEAAEAFARARLTTWLAMDREDARRLARLFEETTNDMSGHLEWRRVAADQAVVRELSPEERERVKDLVPRLRRDESVTTHLPPSE